MNAAVNDLTRVITGKESFADCSVQELQQLCSTYPWFAPAHLLLATKLHQSDSPLLAETTQRASLYFPNPLVLQQALTSDATSRIEWEKVAGDTTVADLAVSEYVEEDEPDIPAPAEVPMISEDEVTGEGSPEATIPDDQNSAGNNETTVSEWDPVIPRQTVLESPATAEEVVVQNRHQSILHEEEPAPPEDDPALKIAPLRLEPLDPSKATLTFEPYHTVDYFASQGIRVREEEKPADRFSQQLRSFTEWLKTMKKVPASELQTATVLPEEQKVEKMAEVSISSRDVVTEAMAEVWEKQGNHRKAIETYDKLSLINPSKSAYFAAKIEHLNKQLS